MANRSDLCNSIADAVKAEAEIKERISLREFRRVHHLLREAGNPPNIHWLIALLGDQAIVQPAGNTQAILEIYDSDGRNRHLTKSQFDFLETGNGYMLGIH